MRIFSNSTAQDTRYTSDAPSGQRQQSARRHRNPRDEHAVLDAEYRLIEQHTAAISPNQNSAIGATAGSSRYTLHPEPNHHHLAPQILDQVYNAWRPDGRGRWVDCQV